MSAGMVWQNYLSHGTGTHDVAGYEVWQGLRPRFVGNTAAAAHRSSAPRRNHVAAAKDSCIQDSQSVTPADGSPAAY